MKKNLIISLFVIGLFLTANNTFAQETQSQKVKQDTVKQQDVLTQQPFNVVYESGDVQIVKEGEKYALYNKATSGYIVKPILDEIELFDENIPTLFKIKINGNIGFVDLVTDTKIITQFQDLSVFDDYIKFKKSDKFGLLSTKADVIIPAEFDQINIIKQDNNKLIKAKYNDKYKFFTADGKEISENNLYQISYDKSEYDNFIQNLKPEISDYIVAQKTEVEKIKQAEYNKRVKVASIEKNVAEGLTEVTKDEILPTTTEITYGDYEFLVIKKDEKIGLTDAYGVQIVPMIFDKIDIDTPSKYFTTPIIIGTTGNKIYAYDIEGREIAFIQDNIINVYWNRKKYKYSRFADKIWDIRIKDKVIGKIVKDGSEYKYKRTGFTLMDLHKPNEIFKSLSDII